MFLILVGQRRKPSQAQQREGAKTQTGPNELSMATEWRIRGAFGVNVKYRTRSHCQTGGVINAKKTGETDRRRKKTNLQ